ncbi:MAG: ATP-dependent Clp protease adaptor ClpS [Flavobacteriales bacterium]
MAVALYFCAMQVWMTQTEFEEDILVEVDASAENKLVLFNDDVHTFDFVIEALIQICGHELLQAEQCAVIVHYNGKCIVKEGTFKKLEPMCTALLDRGLTAEIQ